MNFELQLSEEDKESCFPLSIFMIYLIGSIVVLTFSMFIIYSYIKAPRTRR